MTKTAFDDATRAEIPAALQSSGMEPSRASQAVDLGCHAADKAVDSLLAVVRMAPDTPLGMISIELALQLATARMAAILERAHSLGNAKGAPLWAAEVGMRL